MFASRSLIEHLGRGAVGIACFMTAIKGSFDQAWLPFVLLPLGILMLRGCPMCWTLGLIELLVAKVTGRSGAAACADGGCAAGAFVLKAAGVAEASQTLPAAPQPSVRNCN